MSKRLKQLNKQELWAGIWVLAALLFMLFVYAPTELYCYNMDEFWFDYYNLFFTIKKNTYYCKCPIWMYHIFDYFSSKNN